MAIAKEQPSAGQTILHCGHMDGGLHWFQFVDGIQFHRPDGSHGTAEWFAACEWCFTKHGEKVVNFGRGDRVWDGNGPLIEEPEN